MLAAHQAGLARVLLPKRNEKDYEEIPKVAREGLQIFWLENVDEAVSHALELAPSKTPDAGPRAGTSACRPSPDGRDRLRARDARNWGARGYPLRMRARLLTAALLLLAPLLLLGPVLLRGDRFLPIVPAVLEPLASEQPEAAAAAREATVWVQSDRLFPILTDQRAIRSAVRRGEAPLWSDELGAGLPLAAGSIAGPLYPPNALALLAEPEDAAGPLALITLALSGLGMWLFLGRIGLGRGPRVVAILGVQLGSWAVGNLYYPMKVDAALWVPFALWASRVWRAVARARGPR